MKRVEEYSDAREISYDSIEDLMKENLDGATYANKRRWQREADNLQTSWWGWQGGFAELLNKVKVGWPEGAEIIRNELAEATPQFAQIRSARRRRQFSNAGDFLDIQRVYSGNLDRAWQTTEREAHNQHGSNNAVILVNLVASGYVPAEQARWRGFAAAALVDMLISSGRNVQLWAVTPVHDLIPRFGRRVVISYLIKDFDDMMDLEYVAVMTSTAAFRGFVFRSLASQPEDIHYHFGYPLANHVPRIVRDAGHILHIPGDTFSKEDALRVISNCATQLDEEAGHTHTPQI